MVTRAGTETVVPVIGKFEDTMTGAAISVVAEESGTAVCDVSH